MKKILILFCIIILIPSVKTAFGVIGDYGLPCRFLDLGGSARALGMGKAFTGLANDSSSVYYNPAGLSQVERKELSCMHIILFEGARYDAITYVHSVISFINFGLGVVQLYSGGYEKRDSEGEICPHESSFQENAFFISSSLKLHPKIFFGGSLKSINKVCDGLNAVGFGGDLSILYRPTEHLRLGLDIQNVVKARLEREGGEEEVPLNIRIGFSYTKFLKDSTISLDLERCEHQSIKLHTGIEVWQFNQRLALRAGLDDLDYTGGLGFRFEPFGFDYALINKDLGLSHRISLFYTF
ncbi:MAG: PorV/PorQ family protein [bacterium]|nr:PorV/PorQ family protein [bacterium]